MGSTTKDLPELKKETRFNINHKVKVFLTPRGLEVLRERVREIDFQPDITDDQVERTITVLYLRDGAYIFQMYEFMAIFGPELPTIATMDPRHRLFDGNDIILLPDTY